MQAPNKDKARSGVSAVRLCDIMMYYGIQYSPDTATQSL